MKNSPNIGLKLWFHQTPLAKKSDKLTNHCSNIWPESKPSEKVKTVLRLFSPSAKTNGSQIPLWPRNSNLMLTQSREASVIKSTGKKARTSPSKTSKRKERTKRKQPKNKSNLSSTFSRKLTWLKMMNKKRKESNKKSMMKKKEKFKNLKDNTKSPMSCTKI